MQEKKWGHFCQKWVFFRLKKGEGLVFQSGEDFIIFNLLSLFCMYKILKISHYTFGPQRLHNHEFNSPNTSDNTFLVKPLWLLATMSCIISAVSAADSSLETSPLLSFAFVSSHPSHVIKAWLFGAGATLTSSVFSTSGTFSSVTGILSWQDTSSSLSAIRWPTCSFFFPLPSIRGRPGCRRQLRFGEEGFGMRFYIL